MNSIALRCSQSDSIGNIRQGVQGYVSHLIDPIEEAPEYLPGYGIVVQRKGNDGFNPTREKTEIDV